MTTFALPGRAAEAGRQLGFDTWSAVTPEHAAAFKASGHHFAVRYIKRGKGISSVTNGGSMTREEATNILGARLALMPVQFAKKGLMPTASSGRSTGEAAAFNCAALGFPKGITVWCDVEALHAEATTSDAVSYVNAWASEVKAGGFEPGVYVGPNSRLTTEVLYNSLQLTRYWKSAARVGNVDKRGYCVLQSRAQKIHGLNVDTNIITVDALGGQPRWCEPV